MRKLRPQPPPTSAAQLESQDFWWASNKVCPHPNQGGTGEHQVGSQNFHPWSELSPPNSHLHQAVAGESHSLSSNKANWETSTFIFQLTRWCPPSSPSCSLCRNNVRKSHPKQKNQKPESYKMKISRFQLKTSHHTKKQDLQTTPRGQRC